VDKEWVMIYANTFEPKVSLIREQLESEGIAAILLNKKDSAHIHIGEIELYVKRDSVIRAKNLIEKWENE